MIVKFKDKKLRQLSKKPVKLAGRYGVRSAKRLLARLADLRASHSLEELVHLIPSARLFGSKLRIPLDQRQFLIAQLTGEGNHVPLSSHAPSLRPATEATVEVYLDS